MLFAVSAVHGATEAKVFKLENRDAAELLSLAQQMVSPGGSASVDRRTNAIVATGTPAQLTQLEQLLDELDQALKQVSLTVYVAEVDPTLEQSYGLKMAGNTVLDPAQFDILLGQLDSSGKIEQFMTVTTMSNTSAYLQVSSDKFITLGQQQGPMGGVDAIYERVPVGEFLQVKPRAKPDGSIEVFLTPIVSQSGKEQNITMRAATTHVTIPDGGTVAIGGSATATDSVSQTGVPLVDLSRSNQAGSRRVMMFLTATTETGTNMIPTAPGQNDFENPEVLQPGREVKNRNMHGPRAY